ncbi:hypothetical protein LTR36_009089 [Oleoguttula mirabilis]|uniref:DUF7603 domain-containing protein n=1 Tax=Oleoguttula mirabilis TaxID=1507867 RepID=A0AAV9J757_9PEZI|nr:hypothetical protein LTR36_009089 [Oleoguttula mirabilis]
MSHSHSSSFADDYYTSPHEDTALEHPTGYASVPAQQPTVKKQASLAQISIPSFSAFRSQASSIPVSSPSAPKRKPAPFQPLRSPRAASFSLAEKASPRLADPASRPLSLDSPLPPQPTGQDNELSPPLTADLLGREEERSLYAFTSPPHDRTTSISSRLAGVDRTSSIYTPSRRSSIPVHARYAHERTISHAPKQSVSSIDFSDYSSSPVKSGKRSSMHQQAPSMTLQFDGVQRTLSDESLTSDSSRRRDQRPKSPGGLGAFFGWKSSSQQSGTESPTTTFSDRSLSPLPSPRIQKLEQAVPMDGSTSTARLTPQGLDIHKANSRSSDYFDNPDTPILLGSPETNAHVRELEKELAQVSTELAGSIRREMDLEDELEYIRAEIPTIPHSELNRRSSDYFSDSGASSVRYPVSDPDAKLEQLEQKLRKVEQEKASIAVDMASRLQTELGRRRDLEQVVHNLEEQLQMRFDADDDRGDTEERITELESSLDETRRRLGQERQAKDSFGDLYSATRLELEQHKNERDDLRDNVVPQWRARVEGLETEASDTQALVHENTRMQQELAALKEEVQKTQGQGGRPGISSIAEEDDITSPVSASRTSLSRSNSLARNKSVRGGSIGRSSSVKERSDGRQRSGSAGPHPVSVESIKEIEDQRDALHKALKLLISRHGKLQRDHERAIKKLTSAKEKVELATTPKRTAYHREVSFLKDEVTTLRKRTEDALEQKWEYEKGLSGLKMDLDRAEQETRGLRNLLQERDLLTPSRQSFLSAYEDEDDAEEGMKLSITTAESERDQARQIAEDYRQRALSVQDGKSESLMGSARRMDELADQLEGQVQANIQLRERLAEAVAKGEKEQKDSTWQVEEMQKRLAGMEDSVLAAQQHSETSLGNHEAEVRRIEEATSPSLQRLRISIPDPSKLSPKSPLFSKSPRLGSKKLSEASLLEASRTQMLDRKVRELEGLLREAEEDMQMVVQRVNRSQMEVAELQTERDAALIQMRKLQNLVVEERERAEALME